MFGLTDRGFFVLAVACYGLSAVYSIFLFRKGFRRDDRINYLLLLAAFLFHTAAMYLRGFRLNRCPIHTLYEATTFITWSMVAVYLVVGLWPKLRFLGAFASPLFLAVGVVALMPGLDVEAAEEGYSRVWLSLHVATFLLAYGAFGLSSVASVMYLMQQHDLKFHKLRVFFSRLPSIQRLERVASGFLCIGFVLLTLGLGFSIWSYGRLTGSYVSADPKIVWAILVWAIYLALMVMRWAFHQRGRRFAWGTIAGFVFVLLTFWGTSLWSPLHSQGP